MLCLQILGTPYESPVNLTTSFIGEDTEIGSIQAYTAAGAQGPTTIYLRQDGGLLHAEDGLAVPLRFDVGYGINGASDDLFKVKPHLSQHAVMQMAPFTAA